MAPLPLHIQLMKKSGWRGVPLPVAMTCGGGMGGWMDGQGSWRTLAEEQAATAAPGLDRRL